MRWVVLDTTTGPAFLTADVVLQENETIQVAELFSGGLCRLVSGYLASFHIGGPDSHQLDVGNGGPPFPSAADHRA